MAKVSKKTEKSTAFGGIFHFRQMQEYVDL